MRKALIFWLLGGVAVAQMSHITATLTDPDGQVWNNGSYTITFIPTPGIPGPFTFQAQPFPQIYNGPISSSGVLSVTIPDNAFIKPANSTWQFTLCSNSSAPCQNVKTFVTGANPNLSTTLSNALIAPRFGPGQFAYGYLDAEVSGQLTPGASYFNVTLGQFRTWNGSVWGTAVPSPTTPGAVYVSTICQSTTSCNPGSGVVDESTAIQALVTTIGAKGTMHIVDDLCGIQTWSVQPWQGAGNNIMVGIFEFRGNCPASNPHIVSLDGVSTILVPGGLWVMGEGTAIGGLTPQYGGTGNSAQGTYIRACNPAVYPCPNGGFVQQIGNIASITVSGNLALVTMSGKPFTFSGTAVNNLQQYRIIHQQFATGAATPDNAGWVVSDCNGTGCNSNPQTFHMAVPTGFQSCSGTCGQGTLDTGLMMIGGGGGNGSFGTQIQNMTLDCSWMGGTIGLINGIGQELSGWHHVNAYNCTVAGFRIDQSAAYNGASFASSNSGDYGPDSSNPQAVTCGLTTCACFGSSGANNGTISSFTGGSAPLTFTSNGHGLSNGTQVILSAFPNTGNDLALNGQIITVANATTNTFQGSPTGSGYVTATGAWLGGGPNVCSSLVAGSPGTVPLGATMSVGAGGVDATIFPDTAVNSNFHNYLWTGSAGQQGFALTNHLTATFSDKSNGGNAPVPQFASATTGTTNNYGAGGVANGSIGCGMGFYGIHGTVIDYHHEYALRGICIGGTPTSTATFYYAYTNTTAPASNIITSSVQVINGFAGAANSTEVEIGGSVADAPFIGNINIQGLNMQNGGAALDVVNNVTGETCKSFGSAPGTDYVLTYFMGPSTTATNAGQTGLAMPQGYTTCSQLAAYTGNAFAIPLISTNSIAGYGVPVKAGAAAGQYVQTVTTDTAAGIVDGVSYHPTSALGFGQVVTTGMVPMIVGTGTCSIGQFVIVDTTTNGRVKCTGAYTAGTVIGKVYSLGAVGVGNPVNVLVGLR